MIAKTINYINYNGDKATEKAYFDMTEREMTLFVLKYANDETSLQNYIKRIAAEGNTKNVFDFIDDLLLTAYGTKSDDGTRFIKDKNKTEQFATSEPYSVVFTEMMTSVDSLIDFIAGLGANKNIDKAALKAQAEKEAAGLIE